MSLLAPPVCRPFYVQCSFNPRIQPFVLFASIGTSPEFCWIRRYPIVNVETLTRMTAPPIVFTNISWTKFTVRLTLHDTQCHTIVLLGCRWAGQLFLLLDWRCSGKRFRLVGRWRLLVNGPRGNS